MSSAFRSEQVYWPSKLLSALWTSYPCASSAATACERLKPIDVNCFTGSTSSSLPGVTFRGSSTAGDKCDGAAGMGSGGAVCFFFFPKGKRIWKA